MPRPCSTIPNLPLTRHLCSTRGARPPPPAAADRGRPSPRGAERSRGGRRGGGEEAVCLGGERRGLPPRAWGGREGFRYLNSSLFMLLRFWDSSCLNNECEFCMSQGCPCCQPRLWKWPREQLCEREPCEDNGAWKPACECQTYRRPGYPHSPVPSSPTSP